MPKEVEDKLKRQAAKHGYKKGSTAYDRYVYGTMAKHGLLEGQTPKRGGGKKGGKS